MQIKVFRMCFCEIRFFDKQNIAKFTLVPRSLQKQNIKNTFQEHKYNELCLILNGFKCTFFDIIRNFNAGNRRDVTK